MAINPNRAIQSKIDTLKSARGTNTLPLSVSVQDELPAIQTRQNQSLQSSQTSIRVLDSEFETGDTQAVDFSAVGGSVSSIGNNVARGIGAAITNPVSGLVGSATGFLNSAKDNVNSKLSQFSTIVPDPGKLLSTSGVENSVLGISSQSSPRPSGKNVIIENQLEKYTSYNCIFELGALRKPSVSSPETTYRVSGPDVTILRSGGGGINDRRIQTVYDALGKDAGNLEYFIDEVNIQAVVAPSRRSGLSQATKIEFVVQEPYSMGLFLQALKSAALDTGWQNYLQACYMLELDFVGWDDAGNAVPVEYSNRKIPFKLANIEFDVERGGSTYRVSAYPWNEVALLDEYQVIKDPIEISGPSVFEALTSGPQSLTFIINDAIQTAAKSKKETATDFYLIRFPTSRTATNNLGTTGTTAEGATTTDIENVRARQGSTVGENAEQNLASTFLNFSSQGIDNGILSSLQDNTLKDINAIGSSPMLRPGQTTGDHPFGLGLYAFEEKKDNISIYKRDGIELQLTDDTRTFKFEKGTKINKIIEEVILISQYGKAAINSANDENMIPWFRIEPQVFVIDDPAFEERTGKTARIWVYNIVPYEVNSSVFPAPNSLNSVAKRAKQVVKSYDYLYSGDNKDVLGFDIKFNAAFFTAISADYGELNAGEKNSNREGMTASEPAPALSAGDTPGGKPVEGRIEKVPLVRDFTVGSYNIDRGQNLARQFHQALINSDIDLITADLEIWGDPYYLTDSGMGNYNAPSSNASVCLNQDGCADYQRGQVHIQVNFRTPIDYNQDGTMEFPEDAIAVEGFSGIYRILTVNTTIAGNKFTQTLGLLREKNQTMEGAANQAKALKEDTEAENTNPANNEEATEQTGKMPSDSSGSSSTSQKEPFKEDGELATVRTKNGITAQVAAKVAPNFQGLIDDLENEYDYEIRSLGGYVRRTAVGSQSWSYHASGLALDINANENGIKKPRPPDAPEPTDMPLDGTGSAMEALAAKHGLGWGGAWNSLTDSMHFSAAASEFGTLDWPRNGTIPGDPTPPPSSSSGETQEVPPSQTASRQDRRTVSGTQAVSRPQATSNALSNSQGTVTGLRPYFPVNVEDDRYDFKTGDKIKAIVAALRNQQ